MHISIRYNIATSENTLRSLSCSVDRATIPKREHPTHTPHSSNEGKPIFIIGTTFRNVSFPSEWIWKIKIASTYVYVYKNFYSILLCCLLHALSIAQVDCWMDVNIVTAVYINENKRLDALWISWKHPVLHFAQLQPNVCATIIKSTFGCVCYTFRKFMQWENARARSSRKQQQQQATSSWHKIDIQYRRHGEHYLDGVPNSICFICYCEPTNGVQ